MIIYSHLCKEDNHMNNNKFTTFLSKIFSHFLYQILLLLISLVLHWNICFQKNSFVLSCIIGATPFGIRADMGGLLLKAKILVRFIFKAQLTASDKLFLTENRQHRVSQFLFSLLSTCKEHTQSPLLTDLVWIYQAVQKTHRNLIKKPK